jgi:hypothetical protein
VRLIKFGQHHVNPDHVVVVSEDNGRILIKLSTGEWIDAEASDVSNVVARVVGAGQAP